MLIEKKENDGRSYTLQEENRISIARIMENRINAQLKDLAFNRKTRNQESGENLSLNGCKLRDLVAETFGYYMAYALYSSDSFLKQMQKGVINVFFCRMYKYHFVMFLSRDYYGWMIWTGNFKCCFRQPMHSLHPVLSSVKSNQCMASLHGP